MASVTSTSEATNIAGVVKYVWSISTGGDTGAPIKSAKFADKTVHITATFGSVTLRGSNKASPDDATAGDWFDLTDPQGNALTFTAAGGKLIAENPLWISPITTGGSDYTVTIVAVE